jgi:hypothetical protein
MKQLFVIDLRKIFPQEYHCMKILQYIVCIVLFCTFSDCASANNERQFVTPVLPPLSVCMVDAPEIPADITQLLVGSLNDAAIFLLVDATEKAAIVIRITQDEDKGVYVALAEAGAAACLPWEPIRTQVTEDGLKIFIHNLRLAQRMQGLFTLSRAADTSVTIRLSFYRSGAKLENDKPLQEGLVLIEGRIWHLEREETAGGFTAVTEDSGQAVILSATNVGTGGVYVYGVNFTASGKIFPFTVMPNGGESAEAGFVKPGATVEFNGNVLILEDKSEAILVLRSEKPLDLSAFAATGFYTAFSSKGKILLDDAQGTW